MEWDSAAALSHSEDRQVTGIVPPLFRGLVFGALGEAAGWLFGIGKAMERVLSEELYDFSSDPVEPTIPS